MTKHSWAAAMFSKFVQTVQCTTSDVNVCLWAGDFKRCWQKTITYKSVQIKVHCPLKEGKKTKHGWVKHACPLFLFWASITSAAISSQTEMGSDGPRFLARRHLAVYAVFIRVWFWKWKCKQFLALQQEILQKSSWIPPLLVIAWKLMTNFEWPGCASVITG